MTAKFAIVALTLALCACATTSPQRGAGAGAASIRRGDVEMSDSAAVFVANATAMIGQPYRYGGAVPGGFDCSGLVFYAAAAAGVPLPRTAQEQLQAGRAVSGGELRAGDLVFMHLQHKELHVGIALDANRFVHAPSTGGRVRIDSLRDEPYSRGFLAARRILTIP